MSEIRFTVPGQPGAKGRPKFTTIGGFARAYTDKKTLNYESLVIMSAMASGQIPDAPLDCPIEFHVVAVFERTKDLATCSKKGKYKYPTRRIPKTTKVDIDNTLKILLDSLNHSGIWRDDSLIWKISAEKYHVAIGEQPHVEVIIRWSDCGDGVEPSEASPLPM